MSRTTGLRRLWKGTLGDSASADENNQRYWEAHCANVIDPFILPPAGGGGPPGTQADHYVTQEPLNDADTSSGGDHSRSSRSNRKRCTYTFPLWLHIWSIFPKSRMTLQNGRREFLLLLYTLYGARSPLLSEILSRSIIIDHFLWPLRHATALRTPSSLVTSATPLIEPPRDFAGAVLQGGS